MPPHTTVQDNAMPNFLTMDLDTVTIRLEETKVKTYKASLSAVSPYFKNAFGGRFVEADEYSVFLEGVSEQTFRIFLHWLQAQSLQYNTTAAALAHNALLPSDEVIRLTALANTNDATTTESQSQGMRNDAPDGNVLFDEEAPQVAAFEAEACCGREIAALEEYKYQFFTNTTWLKNVNSLNMSIARLYLFADRYSVPQLRDDILTALVGQSWKWDWWPELEKDFVDLLYGNLPVSSKLLKFIAFSTTWVYIASSDGGDAAYKMQSLRSQNPDLAFEVGLVLAAKVQEHSSTQEPVPVHMSDNLENSCLFHEHAVFDEKECRQRIAARPHIFTAILEACLEETMT